MKPIFMKGNVPCNSLFQLCKNLRPLEKGTGAHNFKNGKL